MNPVKLLVSFAVSFLQLTPYDYDRLAFVLQNLTSVEIAAHVKPEKVYKLSHRVH